MKQVFIFSITVILLSCESPKKSLTVDSPIYSSFNGFYFFKKGMNTSEFEAEMNKRNLVYKSLPLTQNSNKFFFPIQYNPSFFGIYYLLKTDEKVQIFEISNFTILNRTFPSLQVGFVNDTLLYLTYESNIEASFNKKTQETHGNQNFNTIVNHDLDLIKVISKGIEEKYGYPYLKQGNLDAFQPTTKPIYSSTDRDKSYIQYWEKNIWINKDSSMHIYIDNSCIRETFFFNEEQSTKSLTNFSVLFDKSIAEKIKKNIIKMEDEEEFVKKRKNDSIQYKKFLNLHKQIDSL